MFEWVRKVAMDLFYLRSWSRDEVLLMKESLEEKKVIRLLTKQGEDVFWTVAVPSGCRWASDISSPEAEVTVFVFQTLKDESEKLAAKEVVTD